MIDFQWSGMGLGICDVMYLVLGAFNLNLWQDDCALEKKLIRYPVVLSCIFCDFVCILLQFLEILQFTIHFFTVFYKICKE